MSRDLFTFAGRFVDGQVSAIEFVDSFIVKWKAERDAVNQPDDPPELSECLSSNFCVADLYNPDTDREEYEFDEVRLKHEVKKLRDGMKT